MHLPYRLLLILGLGTVFAAMATLSGCSPPHRSEPASSVGTSVYGDVGQHSGAGASVDPGDATAFDELLTQLETKRVVYVGETHDRYDHHLNQLAIIRGLRERGVDLAVGMEFFQEPFQQFLDAYVAGDIEEKELLKKTEYYDRWRFDFRYYREILTFARQNAIPLIALNVPSESVDLVSDYGMDGLSDDERERISTDATPPSAAYEARLRPAFEMHGELDGDDFRRFVDVQLLWDEHMARVAGDYLTANPGKTMVILAGSGHVAYQDAIPGRLARLAPGDHAVVVTGPSSRYPGGAVDAWLAERDISLEPSGRFGMLLASDDGGVTIRAVHPGSPAAETGLRSGDRLLNIAGESIRGMDDVRLALLDRMPGDEVWVEIERSAGPEPNMRQARVVTLF